MSLLLQFFQARSILSKKCIDLISLNSSWLESILFCSFKSFDLEKKWEKFSGVALP